jgi:hypothetical protein
MGFSRRHWLGLSLSGAPSVKMLSKTKVILDKSDVLARVRDSNHQVIMLMKGKRLLVVAETPVPNTENE